MASVKSQAEVGTTLREWRERRRLTQLDLAPVHEALGLILARHDPYLAVAVDRHWNLIAAKSKAPINVLRLGLHPRGLAPLMVNLSEWRAHFRDRPERQVETIGDESLQALQDLARNRRREQRVLDRRRRHGANERL
jgi:hypothetical protein